jgi:hypothetical protein
MPSQGPCKLLVHSVSALGVNKATELASTVNVHQTASFRQTQPAEQFDTITMSHFDHNPGLEGTPRELATNDRENSPSVGFLSLKAPVDDMYHVIWDMNVVPMPSPEPIEEGWGTSAVDAVHGLRPSHPLVAFDTDTWNLFPETSQATDLSSFPVPLGPEGPLTTPQGARVLIDRPIDFDSFINMNAPMSRQQMPYTPDVNLTYDFGNSYPALVPTLVHPGHIPNAVVASSSSNEDGGGFVNMPGLMMGVDPPSTWANPPSWHGNAIAEWSEENARDVPSRNELNITTSSLRIRGPRSPPQTYEGDVGRLYDRLMHEGADIGATMFLRYVIFAEGVNAEALMAPIPTGDMFHVCDGASRMWEMLLETKEVVPGEKRYCCLLCPVKNRREYRHDRDAVRHFNKDHFGISFPCEYW